MGKNSAVKKVVEEGTSRVSKKLAKGGKFYNLLKKTVEAFTGSQIDDKAAVEVANGFRQITSENQELLARMKNETLEYNKEVVDMAAKKFKTLKKNINTEAGSDLFETFAELDKVAINESKAVDVKKLSLRAQNAIKKAKVPASILGDESKGILKTKAVLRENAAHDIQISKIRNMTNENLSIINEEDMIKDLGKTLKLPKTKDGHYLLGKKYSPEAKAIVKVRDAAYLQKRGNALQSLKQVDDDIAAIHTRGTYTPKEKALIKNLEATKIKLKGTLDQSETMYKKARLMDIPFEEQTTKGMHPIQLIEEVYSNKNFSKATRDKVFKQVYTDVSLKRNKLFNGIKNKVDFSFVNELAGVRQNTSIFYEVAEKKGLKNAANMLFEYDTYLRNASIAENQMKPFMENILYEFNALSKESKDKVRTYVTRTKLNTLKEVNIAKDSGLTDRVFQNVDTAKELGMEQGEIDMAHKFMNTNRIYLAIKEGLESGTFESHSTIPRNYKNWREIGRKLDPKDPVWTKTFDTGFGDSGMNYWHRSYTEEALASEKDRLFGKAAEEYTPRYMRERLSTEENFHLRHDPSEEITRYVNSFFYDTSKAASTKKLARVAESLSGDVAQTVVLTEGAAVPEIIPQLKQAFGQLKKSHEAIFNKPEFMTNVGYTGISQKLLFGSIDVTTSLALSSPVTAGFNAHQPFTNSIMYHGFANVFNGYVALSKAVFEATPKMIGGTNKAFHERKIFEFVTSKKWLKKATETVIDEKSLSKYHDVLDWYFHVKNPDVLMTDAFHMEPSVSKIFGVVTSLFSGSDIFSRGTTLVSVAKQTDAVFAGYKGKWWKDEKALNKIVKSFHLEEFDAIPRRRLHDLLRTGQAKEFRREFATSAVEMELFDYTRIGRATITNKLILNPLASRAGRFLSWNMFYTDLMKGVKRSWDAGDKEPLINLAKNAAIWYGVAVGASSLTDEGSFAQGVAKKGISRTPFAGSLMAVAGFANRPTLGIGSSTVSTIFAPLAIGMDETTKALSGKKRSPWSYDTETVKGVVKYSPQGKVADDIGEIFDDFFNLFSGDNNE